MRTNLFLGLATAVALAGASPDDSPANRVIVTGTVRPLTEILRARGVVVDPAPIASQVALERTDGVVVPLLLDDASRALFFDARLRDRPTRIEAKALPGLPYLQVLTFQVREGDTFRTPEYWCDVCSIRWRFDPELCPCCQGAMELRYQPTTP